MLHVHFVESFLLGILEPISSFFYHHRYITAFFVSALKSLFADIIAQKAEKRGKQVDDEEVQNLVPKPFKFQYKRNIAFVIYGGIYGGCFQEYLYNEEFTELFGSSNGLKTAVIKVLFNMFVIAPFLCLPMAYVFKAFVFGMTMSSAMRNYIHDVRQKGLVKKYWMVWGPVNTLTFSIVPEHMRITFIASISFFWCIVLSSISGKNKGH